jgi:ornithine cyclodeaminase/alanine dehydrogenase-like protein (mu-crystallin family)
MEDCIAAVESAFDLLGSGRASKPVVASIKAAEGGYHIKSAILAAGDGEYFVSKTNANYPANPGQFGLPTVQGTIVVHDARNGVPLAVMDSIEITAMRTAAASAVAARYLSNKQAGALAIIGCGLQGLQHLRALSLVRQVRSVTLHDVNEAKARSLAGIAETELRVPVRVTPSPAEAARNADLIATCTTSTEFVLRPGDVARGAFVAAVGVDAEHKRELDPELLRTSRVVTDVTDQCAAFGDLHHAIDANAMRADDVHAELGSVVARRKPGRTAPDERFVFDSTGMALQDAATAVVVLRRARAEGLGVAVQFSA